MGQTLPEVGQDNPRRGLRGLLINRSLVTGVEAIDRNRSRVFLKGCQNPLVISRLETSRLRKSR